MVRYQCSVAMSNKGSDVTNTFAHSVRLDRAAERVTMVRFTEQCIMAYSASWHTVHVIPEQYTSCLRLRPGNHKQFIQSTKMSSYQNTTEGGLLSVRRHSEP